MPAVALDVAPLCEELYGALEAATVGRQHESADAKRKEFEASLCHQHVVVEEAVCRLDSS